jgi:hypothetical protein
MSILLASVTDYVNHPTVVSVVVDNRGIVGLEIGDAMPIIDYTPNLQNDLSALRTRVKTIEATLGI